MIVTARPVGERAARRHLLEQYQERQMKIFVTGGSGFIGAHTTMALLDAGHEVRLLVRNQTAASDYYNRQGYSVTDYVVADLQDTDAVIEGMAGCDAFFHAAAMVSIDPRQAEEIRRTNQGTIRALMQGALDSGIQNIVYVSSLIALFAPGVSAIDENSPLGTFKSPYATSKRECDAFVRELQAQGAPIQITYASGVYGPEDPKLSESNDALISFLSMIPNTTSGMHCVDVRDLAQAHLFLLENPVVTGVDNSNARYIVGGHYYTWPEFHRLICDVTSRDIKHPRMPAALLRGMGRTLDLVRKFRPVDGPMSAESMQVTTRFPVADSSRIEGRAGLRFRPGRETFADTLAWMAREGHIKPRWAGLE